MWGMKGLKKTALFTGDVATLYLALVATIFIRYPSADFAYYFNSHVYPFSLIFILWLAVFFLSDLYQFREYGNKTILFKRLAGAVILSGTASAIAFYLFGQFFELTPKVNLLIFSVIFFVLNYFWRILITNIFTSGAAKVLILGDAPILDEIGNYLAKNGHTGYQVAEHIKDLKGKSATAIEAVIKDKKISTVVIQPNLAEDFSTLETVFHLLPVEVNLVNAWDFYEIIFEKVPLKDLKENWFIEKISTRRILYDGFKRVFDITLSAILGIILLPFGLIFALIIRATSPGRAVFKQERAGKNGKVLILYKLRTMYAGNDGPLWTEEKDKRITPFGKILRFSHMDEIPQLWNIFRGDISFTGPRPERVELAETFKKFPYYEIRHIIKPGLSGWAQINYKPSASMEEAYEKLCYDIYYVKNRSVILDLIIVLKTIKYLFISHF